MIGMIKEKVLKHSGSYNYYKSHYSELKNKNEENKEIIRELNEIIEKQENKLQSINLNKDNRTDYPLKTFTVETNNSSNYDLERKLVEDEEYTFSIIIPIYNSSAYLEKCVNSVITQSVNFKENVQLILVDDGSSDDSIELMKELKTKYPNNIIIISQEHQGQSVARNSGLKFVKGKFVNFLDSDDILSDNTLEEVFKFSKENSDINIMNIPLKHFGKENYDDVLNDKFLLNKNVLNLADNPCYPLINLSSTFIKFELINKLGLCFDEDLSYSEDALFLNQLIFNNEKIGLVTKTTVFHRERFDFSSQKDLLKTDEKFFLKYVQTFCEKLNECFKIDQTPKFIQYWIIYEFKEIIFYQNKHSHNDVTSNIIKKELINLLKKIDSNSIKSNRYLDDNLKSFLLYLKYDEISFDNLQLKINNIVVDDLSNHKIHITNLESEDDLLTIHGYFSSNLDKNKIKIELIKEFDNKIIENFNCIFEEDNPKFDDDTFLGIKWIYNNNFVAKIPLQKEEIVDCSFNVKVKDDSFKPQLSFSNYCSYFENDELFIKYHRCSLLSDKISIERGYNFSIIMAVYNTGNYLYETIDSLIKQTLSFEENVQLILVDDGSSDNSLNICYEYQEKYPENIIVLSQENSGQAIARNNGLDYAKGKYINFLDSDDYISENTLHDILLFFDNNIDSIDMVAMPIKMFGRLNKYHILQGKFNRERIIDLKEEPNNPQLSASSAFFKNSLFPKFKFAEDMITSEDSIMINKILLEKQKYGVINSATYYYRKRFDSSSTIDNSINQKAFYTEKLQNYFLALQEYSYAKLNEIPLFIQYLIAYDIQWIIKEPIPDILDESEKNEFFNNLKLIVSKLDEEVVLNNEYITNEAFKDFFLYLINDNIDIKIKSDTVICNVGNNQIDSLKNHKIWLDIVEIKDNNINISGFLNSYFKKDSLLITAIKENSKGEIIGEYIGKYVKYTSRKDVVFLDHPWQFKYNFDIQIPIKDNERCFIKIYTKFIEKTGKPLVTCRLDLNFNIFCRLSKKSDFICKDSHILRFHDNLFELEGYRYKKMNEYESLVRNTIDQEKPFDYKGLLKLRRVYSILYYIKNKFIKKPIYLFMDRTNKADDNAEHLFKYAVKQKDGIIKYFVVEDNNEYSRVKKIGKTLKYNSFKHRLLYLLADKVISSHPDEYVLNPFFEIDEDQRRYMNSLITSDTYFLQHGVTLGNVSDWLRKYDKNLAMIVSIADNEHDSFLEEGYNYDENIIQTLGFPRYDNLTNDSKKQILIIPTWRSNLEVSEELFKNSSYFKTITNILNNENLINTLNNKGYTLIFKPHPRLENKIPNSEKRFIDLFDIKENVVISQGRSYQELFRDSDMLITDYSSVAFDFAYLKKPIIYFQPDDDYHHEKGYFDFEDMGFGEVITEKNNMFNKINYYLDNNCKMEEKYMNRVDKFFKYNDNNNCKRVYDWIKKH